jgi:[ribosomal protein S5]-alanine N-acetyltransferase
MTPELATKRLFPRPLELADANQMQVLLPQWEIVRYLALRVPWPFPPDGALPFIRDVALPAWLRPQARHSYRL